MTGLSLEQYRIKRSEIHRSFPGRNSNHLNAVERRLNYCFCNYDQNKLIFLLEFVQYVKFFIQNHEKFENSSRPSGDESRFWNLTLNY